MEQPTPPTGRRGRPRKAPRSAVTLNIPTAHLALLRERADALGIDYGDIVRKAIARELGVRDERDTTDECQLTLRMQVAPPIGWVAWGQRFLAGEGGK